MVLGKLPLITMITARMAWLGQRQQVLAQNIANAGTPGYKPLDVKPLDFHGLVRSAARRFDLATTDARHRTAARRAPTFRVEAQKTIYGTTPSGSTVVIEEQLSRVAQTVMSYRLMTSLYRKHVNMIRTALGRGGA